MGKQLARKMFETTDDSVKIHWESWRFLSHLHLLSPQAFWEENPFVRRKQQS